MVGLLLLTSPANVQSQKIEKVDSPIKFEGIKSYAEGKKEEPKTEAKKEEPKKSVKKTPIYKVAVLPPSEIDPLLKKYFGNAWQTAKRVAQCESGLRSNAHNSNSRTGDNSFGLFQINLYGSLAKNRPSGEWLLNAENNIQYAAQMSNHGKNWRPWSCARKLGIR